ncbi:uncharacterized protein LOC108960810 [Eucalyptus grandis]|uniref:uncharacterized protein LOC108960810 n=1 Tax=Eucalyptus grandis TaxID=71139 RepID=UPI00192EE906|nr:uncharacterized protein LOC108960810 [Eucalyptus grandis]
MPESSMRRGVGSGSPIISGSMELSALFLLQASRRISGPFSRTVISCSLPGEGATAMVHRSQFCRLPMVIPNKGFRDNLGHSDLFFRRSSNNGFRAVFPGPGLVSPNRARTVSVQANCWNKTKVLISVLFHFPPLIEIQRLTRLKNKKARKKSSGGHQH